MSWFRVFLFLAAPALLTAQVPDSVHRVPVTRTVMVDSVTVFFTQVDTLVLSPPAPAPPVLGVPFGPSGYLFNTSTGPFTFAPNEASNKASALLNNISEARARGIKVQLALPCGPHSQANMGNCLRDSLGIPVFSQQRFDSSLAAILTPTVRAAVIQAVRDGVVVGILLFDEPWVHGSDDGSGVITGNTWGPKGLSRAFVDQRCAQVKALVPGVPVGTSDHTTNWDLSGRSRVCDYGQFQYSYRFGPLLAWRDAALARAALDGRVAAFSLNIINGGTRDTDATWDCVGIQFGPKGQMKPNCGMTEAQIGEVTTALLGVGSGGLMMWRYDATRFARADWTRAFTAALSVAKTRAYMPLGVR